jgi:hypothetical protein
MSGWGWGVNDIYWYDFMGLLGGLLAELSKWFAGRERIRSMWASIESPAGYCFVTMIMAVAGAFLVHVHAYKHVGDFGDLLAINVGASAPLIIAQLTSRVPLDAPKDGKT